MIAPAEGKRNNADIEFSGSATDHRYSDTGDENSIVLDDNAITVPSSTAVADGVDLPVAERPLDPTDRRKHVATWLGSPVRSVRTFGYGLYRA